MSLTFTQFKEQVASYANRTAASFVVNSNDLLAIAINDAKRDAQLVHDFNACRVDAYISISNNGALLSSATSSIGGPALRMRKILKLWSLGDTNSRYQPIEIQDESVLGRIAPLYGEVLPNNRAFLRGTRLFVTGLTGSTNFLIDGFQWMPDYDGTVTTDFFLTDYSSWLLLQTIYTLNLYLKEDQRIPLSMAALQDAWTKVLANETSFYPNHSLD